MGNKREYIKPSLQVVELRKGCVLLDGSGTLRGYQYQENTTTDGWEKDE